MTAACGGSTKHILSPVPGRGYVFRNNRHQERAEIITYRMARYVKNHVTDTAVFWRTDGKKISVPVPQPDGGTDEPATGTCCRRAAQNIGAWRGSGRNHGSRSGTGCVIVIPRTRGLTITLVRALPRHPRVRYILSPGRVIVDVDNAGVSHPERHPVTAS